MIRIRKPQTMDMPRIGAVIVLVLPMSYLAFGSIEFEKHSARGLSTRSTEQAAIIFSRQRRDVSVW